jgi:hypothetical protein
MRRLALMAAALTLVAASCTAGDDGGDETSADSDAETAAPAQGVTDDTVKIGFTYINLDDLREAGVIDTNHGPYAEHMQVLVDDLNDRGGINGRMVEVVSVGFDPVGAEAQQADCVEFTEDEEVFAILGGLRGDNVLCYTEQHDTVAVTAGNMTEERLSRSTAPYSTAEASTDRKVTEFVDRAVEEGLFEGKTLAVHATEPQDQATVTDVLVPALEEAGVDVAYESLLEGSGADVGSAAEAAALNTEAMRQAGVDAVFVVGDTIVVGNEFVAADFAPSLFLADMNSALGLAVDTDLSHFDEVFAFGAFTDVYRFEEATFQEECVPAWDAAHPEDPVVSPNDVVEGGPNHTVGLGLACRALKMFTLAAEGAGDDLDNATFQEGLEGVGEFMLPGFGPASLSEGKYDAQDDLLLWEFDPERSTSDKGYALYEG